MLRTLLTRLLKVIANATAVWIGDGDRLVLYQVLPEKRYRHEYTHRWHPRWVVGLHWWARWHWMDRMDEEWVG